MTWDGSPASLIARNGQRWLEAVGRRVSRRRFEAAQVADSTLRRLEELCESLRPFGSARVLLVRDAPAGLFRGIVGAYGSVKGAPHCLVMVGAEGAAAEVGYLGEAAVLEATALGPGTCWVVAADSARDTYHIPKRLDCGIAMLHFELGARGAGVSGSWRDAAGRVAAFVPAGG